jgi:hypothetical protein
VGDNLFAILLPADSSWIGTPLPYSGEILPPQLLSHILDLIGAVALAIHKLISKLPLIQGEISWASRMWFETVPCWLVCDAFVINPELVASNSHSNFHRLPPSTSPQTEPVPALDVTETVSAAPMLSNVVPALKPSLGRGSSPFLQWLCRPSNTESGEGMMFSSRFRSSPRKPQTLLAFCR